MNLLSVAEVLGKVPDGVPAELRRQRLTALLGLSVSLLVAMPGAPLGANPMSYFTENSAVFRNVLFGFNEGIPFNVDQAMNIAYRSWAARYELIYDATPAILFGSLSLGSQVSTIVTDFELLQITPACITTATALIKTVVA